MSNEQHRRATRTRRSAAGVLAVALVAASLVLPASGAGAAPLPDEFSAAVVFSGLEMPTAMAFSPDGKVYVAEKGGRIYVYPNASTDDGVLFRRSASTRRTSVPARTPSWGAARSTS